MRILICDDSRIFAEQLRARVIAYCAGLDYDCSCEIYCSPEELLKTDLAAVQVLFLDIDMPGLNGIELAKRLRETLPELIIIFVTSWIQYAPSGYQVSAFRYLLKANLDREFEACMDDTFKKLDLRETEAAFTGTDGAQFSIPVPHILYLEGSPYRRVYLHTTGNTGAVIECMGKLADYRSALSERGFLQIQRSFLVNMQHIKQLKNYEVFLSNGEVLKASKKDFAAIKSEYTLWKVGRL